MNDQGGVDRNKDKAKSSGFRDSLLLLGSATYSI
jgi:hypothetical protein